MTGQVELSHVSKHYGGTVAVEDVSLEVVPGELVALLGPSGCGKTTTLRMIAGFVRPTSGAIRIGGRDMTALPPHRRNTGMVFQSYALFPHLSVAENIAFGLKRRRAPKEEIRRRVDDIVAVLRLQGLEQRLPRQLSGGQQQRVAVGRALVINPAVLLLDEPFSNLDAQLRESTRVEMRRLQQRLGITTVFVTHDQAEALSIADRIAVMNAGRIEQVGDPTAVYRRPASQFVANFIGRANLFDGTVVERGQSGTRARSSDGVVLQCDAPVGAREAIFLVRPESIRLSAPNPTQDINAVAGRVDILSFQGPTSHIEVVTEAGRQLLVELSGAAAQNVQVGHKVTASWDSSSVAVCER
jgi:putative spermidine/putrescine transport system ATP-binding protein